jgi:hypothetical protein
VTLPYESLTANSLPIKHAFKTHFVRFVHHLATTVEKPQMPRGFSIYALYRGNGQEWIRTTEGVSQRIYSPPRLATSVPTRLRNSANADLSYWLAVSKKRG